MMFMPKSAVPINQEQGGYKPKSAVPISQPKEKDNRTLLQKISKPLGLGTTVENIQTAVLSPFMSASNKSSREETDRMFSESSELIKQAKLEQDPIKKKELLDRSRQIGGQQEDLSQELQRKEDVYKTTGGITKEDMGRSNLEFATRRGLGQTAELASWAVPFTKEAQALRAIPSLTKLGRVALAGGEGAIVGGLQGVSKASKDAESIAEAGSDVSKTALTGALTGAVTQGAFELPGLMKGFIKKISKPLRDSYKSTLKRNIADVRFYKQAGGENKVIDDIIRLNIPNSKEGVINELSKYGEEYGQIVDNVLNKSEKAGQSTSVLNMLSKVKNQTLSKLNRPETRSQYNAAKNYFDDALEYYGKNPDNTWREANEVRKLLDEQVGGQILDRFDQGQKFAMKNFATEIRQQFKGNFEELVDPIRKYHLLSGLSDAFKKEPIFGLPEITASAVGASTTGLPGLLYGLGAKAIRSPQLKRETIKNLLKFGQSPNINVPGQTAIKTGLEQFTSNQ